MTARLASLLIFLSAFGGCATAPTNRKPSSTNPNRCFLYGQFGWKISLGSSFDVSAQIWPHTPWNGKEEQKTSLESFEIALRQLKTYQNEKSCPAPEDANQAQCLIEESYNPLAKYKVKIVDGDGIRTLVSSSDVYLARQLALKAKTLGQCAEVAEKLR